MIWFYLLVQLILVILMIAGAIQFFNILFRGHAPFIITRPKVAKTIAEELKLKPGDVVYELGSGTASILKRLAKKYPRAKYYGIEYALIPWLIAKIQLSLFFRSIKVIKKNFFDADLSQADYIYCFLNIDTMVKLETKLLRECKKNAELISYVFRLPNIKPYKTILVGKSHIYFYLLRPWLIGKN